MQEKKPSKRKTPAYEAEKAVFATNLRECMRIRGENQSTLAKKIDVQRQTISLYMNGQSSPNTETLTDIANALGVSADYLLGLSVVPVVDINLHAAQEYTGLTPHALQNIKSMSTCYQQIGHSIYNPLKVLSLLCENPKIISFLFDLVAAIHFMDPPEYSYETFLSEAEFRFGSEKRAMLEAFSLQEFIDLVAPLNEYFGSVALDNDHAAEHYLNTACSQLKEIVYEIIKTESEK